MNDTLNSEKFGIHRAALLDHYDRIKKLERQVDTLFLICGMLIGAVTVQAIIALVAMRALP